MESKTKPTMSKLRLPFFKRWKGWRDGSSAFISASADALILFDKSLNFVRLNAAAEKLANLFGEDVAGKNILDVVPNIKETGRYDKYLNVIETGKPFSTEDIVPHPKFGNIHLSVRAFKAGNGLGMIISDITGLKSAEKALRGSEEKYRAIVETTIDGIYQVDTSGKLVFMNESFARTFGYQREELLGKHFSSLLGVETFPEVKEMVEKVLAGENVSAEVSVQHKDGHKVPASFSATPLKPNGNVIGLTGILRDITEHKRMEEALRKQAHDLGKRVKEISCIQAISDIVVSKQDVSLEEMLQGIVDVLPSGWQYPEITSAQISFGDQEFITKNFRVTNWKQSGDIIAHGNRLGAVEVCYLEEKPEMDEGPFLKEERALINVIAERLGRIIERKKAEGVVRDSEKRYRQLIDNMQEGLWLIDKDAITIFVNPCMAEILGYTAEEMLGKHLFEFMDERGTEVAKYNLERRRQGIKEQHDFEFTRKDGARVYASLETSPITDEAGNYVGALACVADITERKKAQEALRQSEERFRRVLDNAVDMIYWVNFKTGKYDYVAPSSEKVIGYTPDEFIALGIAGGRSLAHPDDLGRLDENVIDLLTNAGNRNAPSAIEYRFAHKKLGYRWVFDSRSIVYDGDEPVAIVGSLRDITERKKAEEELWSTRERLQLMFDSVDDGIAVTDLEGFITEVNKRGLEMCAASTKEEVIGKSALELIVPEEREKAMAQLQIVLEQGAIGLIEHNVVRADGFQYLAELNASVLKNISGNTTGFVVVLRDVTERQKSEEALRQSEQRYRLLAENAKDIIWTRDMNLKLTYTSPSVYEISGYSVDEVMSMSLEESMTPASLELIRPTLSRVLAAGEKGQGDLPEVLVLEVELIHKDGSTVPVEMKINLLRDSAGHPTGFLGVTRDITERKKAGEALKLSEERYRLVVENASEAIVVAQDGMLKFSNSRATVMLGYSKEEMASKPFIELIHPDDQQMVAGRYMARLRGEELPAIYSFRAVDRAGNVRWVEISAVVIKWEGSPATLNFLTDITERKKAEGEKQRMEEQLRLAGRLAAVGELSAGVAHELNNPIAAIQGFAQLLTGRNDLDETMKNDLGIIYREAQRAAKITQNLLSFARRHEPEKHLISLNEVIEKTLELRAYQMKVTNIEVVVEFATDLPKTTADFFQMQQVFVNIINNAEQAMVEAHRKGRLVVKTQKAGNMIQATFADDGPGISEDNLKRIFDPFFTTKEVGKGTGLGLSICYGIVEAHGGRIYARSKLGQGATVVVEIPIVAEGQ